MHDPVTAGRAANWVDQWFATEFLLGPHEAHRRAVETALSDEARLLAAVRAGEPPIDTVRAALEPLLQTGAEDGHESPVQMACRALHDWAVHRGMRVVRSERLHWNAQIANCLRTTYVLPAEALLDEQIRAGHSVVLATTEEPRRFARYVLREYVGKRSVFLWTIASGLFQVRMNDGVLKFFRAGDVDGYEFTVAGERRLSEMLGESNHDPRLARLLLSHDGFRKVSLSAGDDDISGFVKAESKRDVTRLLLVWDDIQPDGAAADSKHAELAFQALRYAAQRGHAEARAWPPELETKGQPPPFVGELQYIMQLADPDALYLLLDGNLFLEPSGIGHVSFAAAFLKDASARLRRHGSGAQVVVLSTPLNKSRELTDELVCVDLPLPTRPEILVELRRQLEKHGALPPRGLSDPLPVSDELSLLADSAAGMTLQDIGLAVRRAAAGGPLSSAALVEAIQAGKQVAVRRSPALELMDRLPPVAIKLGGLDRLIKWLEVRKRVFDQPEKARQYGIERRPKGVLLLGIPGTGKSLAAKIIAREWKLPLVRLDMGAIHNSFVGASEERMREALRIVDAMSPCVLWIDEIDKGIAQGEGATSNSIDLNIRATLLTWLQESRAAVFCVATANRFAHLPPELTRAGRFDARFFLGCPDRVGREEILGIHLEARGIEMPAGSLDDAIESMHGFTGAEIEQCVLDALYAAFADERRVTVGDIAAAALRVKPIVRAVGSGLEEVWALIDQGRVELASDSFLARSDLAKLIDPTLFAPMYCRLQTIQGWETHSRRAEKILMADPFSPRAAAVVATGDAGWLFVQTNVRFEERDEHYFKFLDEVSTVAQNGVLDTLVAELGVEFFLFEDAELCSRLGKEPGFAGYSEMFKVLDTRSPS